METGMDCGGEILLITETACHESDTDTARIDIQSDPKVYKGCSDYSESSKYVRNMDS